MTPAPPPPASVSPDASRLRLLPELVEMFRELAGVGELLRALVVRDLTLRYRNAFLGFGWAVLAPGSQTVLFTIIFTRVVPLDTSVPYPVFAFTGLLSWNLLASSLRSAAVSLTSNPNLVTKVYFPREVLPLSAVLVALCDFLVASAMLALLMIWYRVGPGWSAAWIPAILLVQIVLTTAVALLVAMANLFYADVKYVLEVLLTIWMFATSVLYPLHDLDGWTGRVLALNPMTPIVDAWRTVLLEGRSPDPFPLAWVAAGSILFLGVSWLAFHRAEFRFAEEI